MNRNVFHWLTSLQKSIDSNPSPINTFLSISTVSQEIDPVTQNTIYRPKNRIIVFRGFRVDEDNHLFHLKFVTDVRSKKVLELNYNPFAEICWYFQHTREQYRLSGVMLNLTMETEIENNIKLNLEFKINNLNIKEERRAQWNALSESTKSQYKLSVPFGYSQEIPETHLRVNDDGYSQYCLLLFQPIPFSI